MIDYEVIFAIFAASFFIAIIGSFLVWSNNVNMIHAISHSSTLNLSLSSIFSINYNLLSIITGFIFSTIRQYLSKIDKLDNIYIFGNLVMIIGFCIEFYFGNSYAIQHLLIGDILLFPISNSIILTIITTLSLIFIAKNFNLIIINLALYRRNIPIFHSLTIFNLSSSGIILFTKIFGILGSSFILGFIPIIARKISNNPIDMLIKSFILSLFILFLSYFLAIYFNIYFSFITVALVCCCLFFSLFLSK
ncbi:metal ABC transporter permease [Candidatus Deianiraea vastatrix]|uniref:ABC 3 transport family protein n=1 Tax=Candidatus Deianiraea vastatrix TaxID=2163644 RepID=A0A5B8XDM1_9RICK|nr:metal ABC transporter permease [Candidatus Deianiraea vastatrix]QED22975.1 ABC 3 transport family protein [Candidatus Deianiraea vastatrix]